MNQTSQILGQNLTSSELFEKATEVTNDWRFFAPLLIVSGLVIFIYLIWGAIADARVGSRKLDKKVIQSANFWVIFFMMLIAFTILILLVLFPIWLKMF